MLVRTSRFLMVGLYAFGWTVAVAELPVEDKRAVPLPAVVVKERSGSESLDPRRTPLSLSVVSSQQVNATSIQTVSDLVGHVPNLYDTDGAARSFGDVYSIRGLSNSRFFSDPAVVLYVDDVPYGNAFTYSTDLLDIERIDVFRGPQGAAFGKNSEAGVIHVVTKRLTNRYEANGTFTYGSFDRQDYRGALAGPVVNDKLYFGIAGGFATRDGFLRNTNRDTEPDDQTALRGRALLTWTPTEDWEISVTGGAEDMNDGVQRIVPLDGHPFRIASDFDGETEVGANDQSVRVSHTAPGFVVKSITARRHWQLDPFTLDIDFSPVPGNNVVIRRDEEQWSQELRVESLPDPDSWRWLAGFYFSTSDQTGADTRNFLVPPVFIAESQTTRFQLEEQNYAVFGQTTYPATERLDVTLGIRCDLTEKEIQRTKTAVLSPPVTPIRSEDDFFNIAPKLTLDYEITDRMMVYGSTGLGFKPGGYSAFIDPPASPRFDTEYTLANEVGIKTSWLDKKLIANLALFYYRIWDYQVERSVPFSTDLTVVNAPDVSSLGAELELKAVPLEGLELSGAFGYTRAQFERFHDPTTAADLADNHVPFVPEFTARLAAQYKHRTGFLGRVEFLAFGRTFYDEQNTAALAESNYGVVNATIGFEHDHVGLYLFGNNLADNVYFTNKIKELNAGTPGEPRTIGVMVSAWY